MSADALAAAGGFAYSDDGLACDGVPLRALADRWGTPLYVYSWAAIAERFARLRRAFGPSALICYAVKANSNLTLLRGLAELGAGFDLVSGGELARLQHLGIAPSRAVFAGVGKQDWEVEAAAASGIRFFNVESPHELEVLERVAAERGRVAVALRLNPDVAVATHDYISTGRRGDKFGLDLQTAAEVVARIDGSAHLELCGYHVHLGSQLRQPEPYLRAFEKVSAFWSGDPRRRRGVRYYDLGGGFGVASGADGAAMDVEALGAALLPRLTEAGLTPVLEPGRFLVADAGVLLTRVLGTKSAGADDRAFALVDAAMNDLIRPALYDAEHPVLPVAPGAAGATAPRRFDVVGPVCESGDFLARGVALPQLQRGDLLSVLGAGAYGMSMASNYNSRPRAAEVLVRDGRASLIRRREQLADLWAHEAGIDSAEAGE